MQADRRVLTFVHKRLGDLIFSKREYSNAVVPVPELVQRRNYLFSQEQKRQLEEVGRVEKITVEVSGPPADTVLIMNKEISTPYECCRHISLPLCEKSPLALLNESILWDMHRPLPGNCRLKFLSFRDRDPYSLNHAFWRTGSLVLGAVISKAFKNDVIIDFHNLPEPKVSTGSFIYDVGLEIKAGLWDPTEEEMRILNGEFLKFVLGNHKIERLQVKKSLALEIFEGRPSKQAEIPKFAAKTEDHLITLYRVADYIDMSHGPMIGDTSFFGRCCIAAVHFLGAAYGYPLYRFQGVALPKAILLNSYAFSVLFQRAQRLNEADIPNVPEKLQPLKCFPGLNSTIPIKPNPTLDKVDI